eukprot:3550938-Lingulodinium_polyedra.AAC.1
MGDEKTVLYASGGSSYYRPGCGVVTPWDPVTDDDRTVSDLNLYFVDKTLAEKAVELFEWMALDNRINADVRDTDAEYQARWAYFDIFGIDPY